MTGLTLDQLPIGVEAIGYFVLLPLSHQYARARHGFHVHHTRGGMLMARRCEPAAGAGRGRAKASLASRRRSLNGRCRNHGGMCAEPKTAAGRTRFTARKMPHSNNWPKPSLVAAQQDHRKVLPMLNSSGIAIVGAVHTDCQLPTCTWLTFLLLVNCRWYALARPRQCTSPPRPS